MFKFIFESTDTFIFRAMPLSHQKQKKTVPIYLCYSIAELDRNILIKL